MLVRGARDKSGYDLSDILRGKIVTIREMANLKEALEKYVEYEKKIKEMEKEGAGGSYGV
jgi:hypothetical protein